jgi:rubrerythrin
VHGAYDIFLKAEQAERLAAEVYLAIAEAFPDAAEAALLKRLAAEEEQHAARIRLLASRYRHVPRLFDNVDFKLQALDQGLAESEALRAEVAGGRWARDLPGLLAKLVELEKRWAGSHADMLAAGADPRIADFFRQLAAQDRAHAALLAV